MMKRQTYVAQLATGQSATRYAFNTANRAGRELLAEWATLVGLPGTWRRLDGALERDSIGRAVHGWSVWQNEHTGDKQRIVVNLVRP
jgi:hypothetical protein